MCVLIVILAFFAHVQSSPVLQILLHSGDPPSKALSEEGMTHNVTDTPQNSTLVLVELGNSTLQEEDEFSQNFSTDALQDFETTDVSDDGNASQEPTENVEHSSNEKCRSQNTINNLEMPCGSKMSPRARRCDVNNIYHVKIGAQYLHLKLLNMTYNDVTENADIKLHRLNKTIPPDAQLQELEKSLQVYFMYLSEAKTIYSTKLPQLNSIHFDFVLKNLLYLLCNLDNGTPIGLPSQTTCLSHDPITFFSQMIYIMNSLYIDADIAMSWRSCSSK